MRFNTKPRKAIVAFGLVGSLILAGCSDDDGGDTATSDTTAQSADTTAAETASGDFSEDNFGPGCADVPAEGEAGSFDAMAQ
ncbi:MAG: hypothetical protein KDB24_08165, partial [Microthrixaceae bacterium]|nr:hypothetical protein [Microthrixaceae bacterium]